MQIRRFAGWLEWNASNELFVSARNLGGGVNYDSGSRLGVRCAVRKDEDSSVAIYDFINSSSICSMISFVLIRFIDSYGLLCAMSGLNVASLLWNISIGNICEEINSVIDAVRNNLYVQCTNDLVHTEFSNIIKSH